MPLFRDFIQNLFGFRSQDDRQNDFGADQFKNPIWQNGDDDDEFDDDRHFGGSNMPGFHFKVFSDPFEMTRYFESQMDSMMKNFFNFGTGTGAIESFDDSHLPALPAPNQPPKHPRDEVLKPGYEAPAKFGSKSRADEDLDGKITTDQLLELWQNPEHPEKSVNRPSPFQFRSFGKSIVSQTIRREDGSLEERKTVTDSQGNAETTVTRKIGDKVHTVITKKGKDGTEIVENFDNFDESELDKFNKNWNYPKNPLNLLEPDSDMWSKFFGPKTKL